MNERSMNLWEKLGPFNDALGGVPLIVMGILAALVVVSWIREWITRNDPPVDRDREFLIQRELKRREIERAADARELEIREADFD